jgi:hypothetical protein
MHAAEQGKNDSSLKIKSVLFKRYIVPNRTHVNKTVVPNPYTSIHGNALKA